MKTLFRLVFLVLSLSVTPFARAADVVAPSPTPPAANAAPSAGALSILGGAAQVRAFGLQGARSVSNNGQIYAGDKIKTEEKQTVMIKLNDGSEITIAANSEMTINKYALAPAENSAEIELKKGMVYSVVRKNVYSEKRPFIIRTQSASMGVRGTEFVVENTEAGVTSLHTLKGSVAIAKSVQELSQPKAALLVEAGKMSTASPKAVNPTEPKVFNLKTFSGYLAAKAPELSRSVEHQQKSDRVNHETAAEKKNEAKKKPKDATPPKKPRPKPKNSDAKSAGKK